MNKEKTFIIALAVIIVLGIIFAAYLLLSTGTEVSTDTSGNPIVSGTTEDGDVEITLTPKGVVNGNLVFDFTLTTHTVELGTFDLRQAAIFEYDGKQVYPTIAPQLGSHHINEQIVFPVQGNPSSYVVRINGIPKQQERIFRW